MDLWQMSAIELARTIRVGQASSREAVQSVLARMDAVNPSSCARRDLNVAELASLDPEGTAIAAGGGAEPSVKRKPQPGLRRKGFAAFEHQKFAALRKIEHNRGVWLPALHPHFLPAVVEQRGDLHTAPTLRLRINQRLRVAARSYDRNWVMAM